MAAKANWQGEHRSAANKVHECEGFRLSRAHLPSLSLRFAYKTHSTSPKEADGVAFKKCRTKNHCIVVSQRWHIARRVRAYCFLTSASWLPPFPEAVLPSVTQWFVCSDSELRLTFLWGILSAWSSERGGTLLRPRRRQLCRETMDGKAKIRSEEFG